MNRAEMLTAMENRSHFDVIIIGGGATGLGAAVDAASRGYSTLLLERSDFAKATSSRSTKLIHGGLRYLQQGNIGLVFEALRERGLLCQNAPHLIAHRPFLVPNYKWWEGPFYGIGLKIYDLLAGRLGLESSRHLNREEAIEALPAIDADGLRGATLYYDGQFDDARLAMTLAKTASEQGGVVLNYMGVTKLLKQDGAICGVAAKDHLTGKTYAIHANSVINATGIFSDAIRQLDGDTRPAIIAPSQGIHLVLPEQFLPGDTALLIPKTDDGRVLFLIPWHGRVIIGTTDTPKECPEEEPQPDEEEIAFVLEHAGKYLSLPPERSDVLSIFAGLRPLVKEGGNTSSGKIARDHKILTSESGLITIAGGKWTTYRKMGMDVIDEAVRLNKIKATTSKTESLRLSGYVEHLDPDEFFSVYGAEVGTLRSIMNERPEFKQPLHPKLPYIMAEVIFACRYEMAQTVEDVLSRRTRSLLLDAAASRDAAPQVAEQMAQELGKDTSWITEQLRAYNNLAERYICR